MDMDASRSPSTVCTASATAMPPMPRPASSGLIWTPRLSSASRNAIAQIASPATNTMMSMELASVGSEPAAFARAACRSRSAPPPWPTGPTWNQKVSTMTMLTTRSMRGGKFELARRSVEREREEEQLAGARDEQRQHLDGGGNCRARLVPFAARGRCSPCSSGSTVKVTRNSVSREHPAASGVPEELGVPEIAHRSTSRPFSRQRARDYRPARRAPAYSGSSIPVVDVVHAELFELARERVAAPAEQLRRFLPMTLRALERRRGSARARTPAAPRRAAASCPSSRGGRPSSTSARAQSASTGPRRRRGHQLVRQILRPAPRVPGASTVRRRHRFTSSRTLPGQP